MTLKGLLQFRLFRKTVEDVACNSHDGRVTAFEAVGPVGGTRCYNGAALGVRAKDGSSNSVFGKLVVPETVIGRPARRTGGEHCE